MVTTSVRTRVAAPRAVVYETLVDVGTWCATFPAIDGARVIRSGTSSLEVQVDHREGLVTNWLELRPPDTVWLHEVRRHYTATFVFGLEELGESSSRCHVLGDISLRGWRRLVGPLVGPYVRRQLRLLTVEPLARASERRTAGGGR